MAARIPGAAALGLVAAAVGRLRAGDRCWPTRPGRRSCSPARARQRHRRPPGAGDGVVVLGVRGAADPGAGRAGRRACRCRRGWPTPTLSRSGRRHAGGGGRPRRRADDVGRGAPRTSLGRGRGRGGRGRADAGAAALGDRHRLAGQPAAGAGPRARATCRRSPRWPAPLAAAIGAPLPVPRYVDVAGRAVHPAGVVLPDGPSCRTGRCARPARAVRPPSAGRCSSGGRAGSGRSRSGQEEHRVAELVPEVVLGDGARRRPARPAPAPATASSSCRWLASGACRPVIRPVDRRGPAGPARARGRSSPAAARVTPSSSVAVSSARVTVVPTATTRRPARRVLVDQPGGDLRDGEPLGVGRLVQLRAGDAGVQGQRDDRDAAGHEPRPAARSVNGRPALAISALPGSVGVDVLVVGQRERRRAGSRSGSAARARAGSRRRRRAGEVRARHSRRRPVRVGVAVEQGEPHAAGQREHACRARRRGRGRRCPDGAAPRPSCRRPAWSTTCSGTGTPSARRASQPRRQRRRGVDHDEVAGLEQVGQVAERAWRSTPSGRTAMQPHLVAGEPAPLGRRGRLGVRPAG